MELSSLIVSIVSLIVALTALVISKKLAAQSITTPVVVNELYDLCSYISQRNLSSKLEQDIDRLFSEINKIREKSFILRQAGFSEHIESIESSLTKFLVLRKELQNNPDLVKEKGKEMTGHAAEVDKKIQALLYAVEPGLEKVFKNPFK
jgi:hypothetical protein